MSVFNVEHGQSIAAVKHQGKWRFFCDIDYMFLLDIVAYEDEIPQPGHPRYNTAILTSENASEWMSSLARELSVEQVASAVKGSHLAKIIFLIDFDHKLWIGLGWHNDQSFLGEYKPEEWTSKEDDPYAYLPDELRTKLTASPH